MPETTQETTDTKKVEETADTTKTTETHTESGQPAIKETTTTVEPK